MTQTEPSDWTQIASQLLQEAGEIRVRFETVTDPEERQRLRDRYFQIDRLLDLAHQMTQASSAPAPAPATQPPDAERSYVQPPVTHQAMVQAPESSPPPPAPPVPPSPEPIPVIEVVQPAQTDSAETGAQPFYFERADETTVPDSMPTAVPAEPEAEAEDLSELVVEVASVEDASMEPVEHFESAGLERTDDEVDTAEPGSASRPRVNVRHVRRIGPKLERQSKNRPLSKRALKARVRLGELTEDQAQEMIEGAQAAFASNDDVELDSVDGVPLASEEMESPLPEVMPDLHKEFAEFPPPELPKQAPATTLGPPPEAPAPQVAAAPQPTPPPAPPPVMPAVAAVPLAPEPPAEWIRPVATPAAAWQLHVAQEPPPAAIPVAQVIYETPPVQPAIPVAPPETVQAIPVPAVPVEPIPAPVVETSEGESLPFTPLSQRIKRVAPPPRTAPSPAASALQRIQARAKEESGRPQEIGRPSPRDVRRRVIETGDRMRGGSSAGTSETGSLDSGSAVSQPRWSFVPGERSTTGWQSRQSVVAEPATPSIEAEQERESAQESAGAAGIRPKLRPGEAWKVPPIIERRPLAEPQEEVVGRAAATPVENKPPRVVEPLRVPSVPTTPPADWDGPVVLPVARRSVEAEQGRRPYRPNAEAEAVFASSQSDVTGGMLVESETREASRTKPYSGALALPATTRDTPNQYSAWMERASHEPYEVRRQYYLIRAYLERYGGPFAREIIVLRHLQKAEALDDFLAMKYYAILALTEVAKLVRGGSTSEIEVILLNAEESPLWSTKGQQALVALYMLLKPKRAEYEALADKERDIAADEPAATDHIYYLLRAMMVKRIGALKDHMAIRRIFEHAQDEWLVWESLVSAAYEALLEVDLFNTESLTRVTSAT
ncbi:MAG: hypothetical protein K1Y02_04165 [Candidatus Hydrogenedentes bacterium]|nr:hypothetical protein [Candidatus Hydrogenedentota bacterium]